MATDLKVDRSPLDNIPLSIATLSIGCRPEHALPAKIDAIASAGFNGIELVFPDLVSFAEVHLKHFVAPTDYDDLSAVARVVRAMCDAKGLEIILLQPFANFEGWREGTKEHADAWNRAEGWIKILKASGCRRLQVCSTDTPKDHPSWSGKPEDIVRDLQELAEKLEDSQCMISYENWCWSTHAPLWKDVWNIVEAIDRSNVGLCLDTFQIAGREWADPTTQTGLLCNKSIEELDNLLDLSMSELARIVPAEKIHLLQISDAYKMRNPSRISSETGRQDFRPRRQWSNQYRAVPFSRGAYLPVLKVVKGVLGTGFRGWLSVEVSDYGNNGISKEHELHEFAKYCKRSANSLVDRYAEI